MKDLVPAHVVGANLPEFKDPRGTLSQSGLRLGGYVRVSTSKEEQRSSIDNQRRLLDEWASLNGHRIVRHYVDVRTGAYAESRKEMEELRQDVKMGRIDGIVTKEISRTSRDIVDLLELKRELARYGACFISIKEGYDSRIDEDEFFLVLHGGLAQRERKATSSRVKLTQMLKAREGKTNVATPAFGYRRAPDGQHLEPDPVRAPLYAEIVSKYLSGWGQSRIARWLNERGIKTGKGHQWYPSSVRTILANPVYLGITIYNATTLLRDPETGTARRALRPRDQWVVKEGTHQPLISWSDWELLQKELQNRRRLHWHEWRSGRRYPGSGVLRCAACGHKLYANGDRGSYCCSNRDGSCSSERRSWDMGTCDRILLGLLAGVAAHKDKMLEAVLRRMKTGEEDVDQSQQRILELLKRNRQGRELESLAFEKGAITLDEYRERMDELRKEELTLRLELDRIVQRKSKLQDRWKEASCIVERMAEMLHHPETLNRELSISLVCAVFYAVYIDHLYCVKSVVFN